MENDPTTESICYTYDISPTEPLTQAIVNAVSAASNADPASTDPSEAEVLEPLYTVVDPDALEAFFRPVRSDAEPSSGRVTFSYHGCEVTVHDGAHITVSQSEARTSEATD